MATEQHASAPPIINNPREEAYVARLREILDGASGELFLKVQTGETALIPTSMRKVLRMAVDMLTREKAFVLEPVHEVSVAQAATFLRVSQQHVDRLLDEGEIPFRRVGEDRCVEVRDLYAYDENRHRLNRRALREMTRIAEESLGGYD